MFDKYPTTTGVQFEPVERASVEEPSCSRQTTYNKIFRGRTQLQCKGHTIM